jgi:excisionase family DNA binding protein
VTTAPSGAGPICATAASFHVFWFYITQYNEHMDDNNNNDDIKLLTVKEAAKLLHLSESGVRELQARRRLAYIKVGGAVRFDKRDIVEYLRRHKIAAMS